MVETQTCTEKRNDGV